MAPCLRLFKLHERLQIKFITILTKEVPLSGLNSTGIRLNSSCKYNRATSATGTALETWNEAPRHARIRALGRI